MSDLNEIREEAELQIELNQKIWDNHQKRCEESILNLAALCELQPSMRLLEVVLELEKNRQ